MSWNHVVIEGFCMCFKDSPPCGRDGVSTFCLGNNHHCPYFYYSKSDEREAAAFVPFGNILYDRLSGKFNDLYWWLQWQLLDRWRPQPSMDYPSAECPELEERIEQDDAAFTEWFQKVTATDETDELNDSNS